MLETKETGGPSKCKEGELIINILSDIFQIDFQNKGYFWTQSVTQGIKLDGFYKGWYTKYV